MTRLSSGVVTSSSGDGSAVQSFFRLFNSRPKPPPIFRQLDDPVLGHVRTYVGPYEITEQVLGHGGNSVVNKGIDHRSNKHVAIKSIQVSAAKLKEIRKGQPLEEAKVMRKLIYSGVCRLYDVYATDTHVYLVMQYVEGRELFDVVKESSAFTEDRARGIFLQLVTVVQYLHSMGTVHNDLKLENILVDKDDEVTLIDFGHASSGDMPASFHPGVPTLEYVAPEVILYSQSSPLSDTWSLGVVLYIMVLGYFPFSGAPEEVRKMIIQGKPKFPKLAMSRECQDLVRRMLCKDPSQRITLEEVKRHPWFLKGLDYYDFDEYERAMTE